MNFLVRIFTILSPFLKRIGLCANVGILAGGIAGISLSFLHWIHNGLVLSTEEAFYVSLILTGFTWLVVLFLLCVLARLTFRSVALPSLFNCLLTCFVTVFLTRALNAYVLAWLIGLIVGFLIGLILCRLNNYFQKLKN